MHRPPAYCPPWRRGRRLPFLLALFFFALLLVAVFLLVLRLARGRLGLRTTRLRLWRRLRLRRRWRWLRRGYRRTRFGLLFPAGGLGSRTLRRLRCGRRRRSSLWRAGPWLGRALRWRRWRGDGLSTWFSLTTLFWHFALLRCPCGRYRWRGLRRGDLGLRRSLWRCRRRRCYGLSALFTLATLLALSALLRWLRSWRRRSDLRCRAGSRHRALWRWWGRDGLSALFTLATLLALSAFLRGLPSGCRRSDLRWSGRSGALRR